MDGERTRKPSAATGSKRPSSRGKDVKVVYISTPMKVKASASNFREIVQELTGKYSDVAGIMEASGGSLSADAFLAVDDSDCDPTAASSSPGSSDSLFSDQFQPFDRHLGDLGFTIDGDKDESYLREFGEKFMREDTFGKFLSELLE